MGSMSTRKNRTWCLLVCVLCLANALQAFGQVTTGTISGTVHDVQGARIAGATVTVRKLDTNLEHSVVTEFDGRFRLLGLVIGQYQLTVGHTGFAKYERGPIVLLLNQDAIVNPVLEVAAATETIRSG